MVRIFFVLFSVIGFAQKKQVVKANTDTNQVLRTDTLYVIDGLISTREAFKNFKPDDIKSVTILKEVGSISCRSYAATYVVTTKKQRKSNTKSSGK